MYRPDVIIKLRIECECDVLVPEVEISLTGSVYVVFIPLGHTPQGLTYS